MAEWLAVVLVVLALAVLTFCVAGAFNHICWMPPLTSEASEMLMAMEENGCKRHTETEEDDEGRRRTPHKRHHRQADYIACCDSRNLTFVLILVSVLGVGVAGCVLFADRRESVFEAVMWGLTSWILTISGLIVPYYGVVAYTNRLNEGPQDTQKNEHRIHKAQSKAGMFVVLLVGALLFALGLFSLSNNFTVDLIRRGSAATHLADGGSVFAAAFFFAVAVQRIALFNTDIEHARMHAMIYNSARAGWVIAMAIFASAFIWYAIDMP